MKKTVAFLLTLILALECFGIAGNVSVAAAQSSDADCVYFGVYYQDREKDLATLRKLRKADFDDNGHTELNGVKYARKDDYYYKASALPWLIVGEEDGCYILLSEYVLENNSVVSSYNQWYSSGNLRQWLNNEFLQTAFTDEELAEMGTGFINKESDYPYTSPGVNPYNVHQNGDLYEIEMEDYVAIPSEEDISAEFDLPDPTACTTEYLNENRPLSQYWLRGPSLWHYGNEWFYYVNTEGGIDSWAGTWGKGIRPVIKVKKNASHLIKTKGSGCYDLDLDNFTFTGYDKDTFYSVKSHISEGVNDSVSSLNNGNHHKVDTIALKCCDKTFLSQPNENSVKLPYSWLGTGAINVTAEGYRDVLIPAKVAENWKGQKDNFTAYMQREKNDGKPYISTVFARDYANPGSAFEEIQDEKLSHAFDGTETHIIISAVGAQKGAKFYLLADGDRTKELESNEEILDLSECFDETDDIYAFFKNPDGTCCEPVKLNIDHLKYMDSAKSIMQLVTFGLIGKDGQSIEISEDVPLVGGLQMSLGAQTFPVGIEIDGDMVKMSWGINLFKRSPSQTKLNNEREWHTEKDGKWTFFKQNIKNLNDNIEDNVDGAKKINDFINSYQSGKIGSDKLLNKGNSITGSFVGYTELQFHPVKRDDGSYALEMILKEGEFAFSLGGKISHNVQTVVGPGIPVYVYCEFGIDSKVGGKFTRILPNRTVPIEMSWFLNAEPSLTLGAGFGIKDVVSGGMYGSASLPFNLDGLQRRTTLSVKGEVGVEGEFFVLGTKAPLFEGERVIYDAYWEARGKSGDNVSASEEQPGAVSANTSLMSRDYLDSTSGWLPEASASDASALSGSASLQTLRRSVYSQSNANIAELGDKLIAAWIEDDASRDACNRTRLMYSVCDKAALVWSEPKAVDDCGRMDAYPTLVSDGRNAFLSWQCSNTVFDESSLSLEGLLKSMDIKAAKYDPVSDSFEIHQLTNNDTYDGRQFIVAENGTAAVYWAHGKTQELSGRNYDILKYDMNSRTTETRCSDLFYITSLAAYGNDIAFLMDDDGNVESTPGCSLYINGQKQDPDDSGLPFAFLSAGSLDGKKVFFASNENGIYTFGDGQTERLADNTLLINGAFSAVEADGKTRFVWSGNSEKGSAVYFADYSDGEIGDPVVLTETDRNLTGLSAVCSGGKMLALCNTSPVDPETGEKTGTDLNFLKADSFTDAAIALPYFDETKLDIGKNTELTAEITNLGTGTLGDITLRLTDGAGSEVVVNKELGLAPGEKADVAVPYHVPALTEATELKAELTVKNDSNPENNTVTVSLGNTDLSVQRMTVTEIGDYYFISTSLLNSGMLEAGAVEVSLSCGDKKLDSQFYGDLAGSGKALVDFIIPKKKIDFTDDEAELKITAVTSSEERYDSNNTDTYRLTRLPEEENEETVFFVNNGGYDEVYAYCWNSDTPSNAAWPGESMTYLFSDGGLDVYSYTPSKHYDYIIFNNNNKGKQTVDILRSDYAGDLFCIANPGGSSPYRVISSYSAQYFDAVKKPDTSEITNTPDPPSTLPGDVNTDGKISVRDATGIQLYLAGIIGLSDQQLALADYNNDGSVDISDATAIQLAAAEIRK